MPAALVTGAGRGLGLEIARALAARGLTVHLTDVDAELANAAAEELGPPAFGSALDVRDPEACRVAAAATVEWAGSLDVWVNNAGILVTGHVWDHDPETRRKLFEVNTLGTINGTLAALERMRAAGAGQVINIVSLAGLGAPPGEALYSATKHGAIAFGLGTLADLRRAGFKGIHVSAVCPDGIWTPMIADRLDDPDAAPFVLGHPASARGRRPPSGPPARPAEARARDPALARGVRAPLRRLPRARGSGHASVPGRRPAPPRSMERRIEAGERV